jgi:hypothetical protein
VVPKRPEVADGHDEAFAALLELQRSAGNRAMQALLARSPVATRRVLQRWADTATAEAAVAAMQLATVAQLRGMIASLDNPQISGDRVAFESGTQTTTVAVADASELRTRAVEKLVERLMGELAGLRAPLTAEMYGATGADRRAVMDRLRAVDTPRLDELRSLTGGRQDRWRHPDPVVQDAVLAAIQLDAVYRAESRLGSADQAHKDAAKACGMDMTDDWCGFFVATSFMQSSLDRDLRAGFFHTENVVDYFTYVYNRFPKRIKKWIWADGGWNELRTYHENRGSVRTWIDAAAIHSSGGAALDIRPGDVALIDHSGSGRPDHIVMVQGYDATTQALFTIGGNDSGYTVDTRATHTPPARESASDRAKREQLEAASGRPLVKGTGAGVGLGVQDLSNQPDPAVVGRDPSKARPRVRVFGIGRPSIVDFEEHYYDGTSQAHAPAAAPTH